VQKIAALQVRRKVADNCEGKIGEMIGRFDILFHESLFFYFLLLGNISEKEDKKMGSQLRQTD
jgi:hypothetical protein